MVVSEHAVWTDRPAISWSRDVEPETKSYYWSQEILDLFRPLGNNQDEEIDIDDDIDEIDENDYNSDFLSVGKEYKSQQDENRDEDEEFSAIFSVSYETLLLLAAGVVQQIREECFGGAIGYCSNTGGEETDDTGKWNRTRSENVVFAVTIPEGPLLPLSILVVHALNVHLHHTHRYYSYAVLVPMDLDEGKDRNSHILNDARPSFALTVPGRDSKKLRELIDANDHNDKIHNDGDHGIGNGGSPAPTTRILNLVDLVKVARNKLSILSPMIASMLSSSSSFERTIRSSCYSQLVASATTSTTTTSLQSLVSWLATQIGDLSLESIQSISEEDTKEDESSNCSATTTNKISHIVYTSGTTGRPKGCVSSTRSLLNYISAKNAAHEITEQSTVLLASALSFDPCLSDVLAAFDTRATLAIAPRDALVSALSIVLRELQVTHVLCTPTLWSLTLLHRPRNPETTAIQEDFPHLERVALGGEPIPKSLVRAWARSRPTQDQPYENGENTLPPPCRLVATYGVTEACVYQTCGEVFSNGTLEAGQCVGHALRGNGFKICEEGFQGGNFVDVSKPGMHGEIVLFGDQIDACTRYLNRPDLNEKFVAEEVLVGLEKGTGDGDAKKTIRYHYRTGDRGFIHPRDGNLVVLGRIVGEEGMIKINGVRVELGEIEAALLSGENNDGNGDESSIITDCLGKCVQDSDGQSTIHAYCVFRDRIWKELGMSLNETMTMKQGIIIHGGPLWTLLRVKCSNRLRKTCIPSAFVGIQQLPLSRTGKRDRSGLPRLDSCSVLDIHNEMSTPLQDYGIAGGMVFETLVQYLNLQPCQQKMVTRSVSFAVLGGDSLSAVVVCRTLYAHFYRLQNSRHLGGEYGQLPEPFNTASLLRAKNLGEYVDLIDENITTNDLQTASGDPSTKPQSSTTSATNKAPSSDTSEKALLYDALLQATTLDQSSIAAALLHLGADPNHGHNHGSRIGNTSGRIQHRAVFKAAPLHLACFRGDSILVKLLLSYKASHKSPNANGLFPIHLASGGLDDGTEGSTPREECRRLECVKFLLEAGCPLLIKDANKQGILHAAARAGHTAILEYAIEEHQSSRYSGPVPLEQFLEFQDKWFRSALHWAVLHGNVKALKVLLEKGSNPSPSKPQYNNRQTSMITETPLEICKRLHGSSDKGIEMEKLLLVAIESGNPL
jgi:acyl-CoA synthetase (AMP-forming)/AMP-acid ligase II/ankyrin repeat protein